MSVRVRIPPSPTGNMHLGTAYTAFFNYLFAKKNRGVFILRWEDTDQQRSRKEFEEDILEGLLWLGFKWDEGPFRQMDRLERYKQLVANLINQDKAYYCFCTPEELEQVRKEQIEKKLPLIYSGKCRSLSKEEAEVAKNKGRKYAVRFKMPEDRGVITFNDLIYGKVDVNSKLIGDFVIMRGSGIPIYNFAVVVDDIDMKITHVLRGEDHLSNTPKQVVLFEALAEKLPEFAHWPNILNSDRIGKLSKREGATAVSDYKKAGFLPEAIINYLALIGWTLPGDKEIMSLAEMVDAFDLSKIRKSPAAFDIVKLEWMNGEYIRRMSDIDLEKRLDEYLVGHSVSGKLTPLIPLVKERIKKLSDFIPLTYFFFEQPKYDLDVFTKLKINNPAGALSRVLDILQSMPKQWQDKEFESNFRKLAEELNISVTQMFQLIRVVISGQTITPPLFDSIKILGEEEVLKRVQKAIKFL